MTMVAGLVLAAEAPGAPVSLTSTDVRASCGGGELQKCVVSAALGAKVSSADRRAFEQGFAAWNAELPSKKRWQLIDGGELPGGELRVVEFNAIADEFAGGVEVKVAWDYDGTRDAYFWSQAFHANYAPPSLNLIEPYRTMDIRDQAAYEAPLYPFQYPDRRFYDVPKAPWDGGFFQAQAFLSSADFVARELRIFGDGIGYEIDLATLPIPGGVLLLATALGTLGLFAARKERKAKVGGSAFT